MENFLDKIKKRIETAKGSLIAGGVGKTLTGQKINKVIIDPDISVRNESFKSFLALIESDSSGAFKVETDLANHLKKHGIMDKNTPEAGSTGGNDFHILKQNGKKVGGSLVPSIEKESETPSQIQGETKKSISTGKMGSVAIRHTKEKGWHIPESTITAKPEFSSQVHNATVVGKDGKTRSLLDHLNHHWKNGTGATPMVTSETTDMSPAHAYFKDHGVHAIHIGDRGTFRGGESRSTDQHELGLPSLEGTGRFQVSTERKRTPEQIAKGTGMQINFRPHAKSVQASDTDISTDEGARKLKERLSKGGNKTSPVKKLIKPEFHHTLFWGRANPPHAGHEAAANVVRDVTRRTGGTGEMTLTRSQDAKKNPLTPEQKLKHAKRAFPNVNVNLADEEHPSILQHLSKLHEKGITHLHMVAGSDRIPEYEKLINKYNGVKGDHGYFNFKKIQFHSSGERDPDADGTAGVSASSQRQHTQNGNFKRFAAGSPSKMKPQHVKELYNDVRAGQSKLPVKKTKKIIG